jgi:hypothetical protein
MPQIWFHNLNFEASASLFIEFHIREMCELPVSTEKIQRPFLICNGANPFIAPP